MCSYLVGQKGLNFDLSIIYIHTLCMQAEKDLVSPHVYAGSPEPLLLDNGKRKFFKNLLKNVCLRLHEILN